MGKILSVVAVSFAACTVFADTYHWTGAEDGRWTNPNNWQEKTVPGRYKDADGNTVGQKGDIVVFGDNLTGNKVTTIDFTNVYSISNLLTEGTTQYTYGTSASQYVTIEPYGMFSAAETPETPAALVPAKVKFGIELMNTTWGGETMTLRNNSTKEFVLGEWVTGSQSPDRPAGASGGQPGLWVSGSGDIRLSKKNSAYMFMRIAMSGKLIIDAPTNPRAFEIKALDGAGPQRIEITAQGSLYPSECGNYFGAIRETIFTGEGTFMFGAGPKKATEYTPQYPVTFHCPVANHYIGSEPPEGCVTLNFQTGAGVLTMVGKNTMEGLVYVGQSGILATDAFGLRGTYGGFGDMDFLFAGNGTLRHTGGDDTTDRIITLTNRTANAAGAVRLEQMGTGPWTVTSPLALAGGLTSGTLSLKGKLKAPATFAGTIDSRISIANVDSDVWTFTPQNDYTGAISVSGGELGLGKSLHLASLTATSGSTVIRVEAGCTIEIDALSAAADKKLNFVLMGDDARVKFASGTVLPAGVTLNGHPVVVNEDGYLTMVTAGVNIWKNAVSGLLGDAANWMGGVAPDFTQDTYIDAFGGDYTVTLDGSEVTMTNIFMNNHGSGTATLLVTNGATLNVKGHTTAKSVLNVGEGAKIDVVDSTLMLIDQGGKDGDKTNRSSVSLDRGEISVRGTSEFVMRGILLDEYTGSNNHNLDTQFGFGTGTVTFDDDAVFRTVKVTGGKTVYCYEIQPTRSGETATMSFKGNSRIDASAWSLALRCNYGRATMEIDTGYTGEMTGWNCNHIGVENGIGEFILTRGKLKNNGWDYMWVATPRNDGTSDATMFTTGRVVIAESGQLTVQARSPSTTQFNGVQFGHGTAMTVERGRAYFYGEMLLSGTYKQERGVFLVGSGANGHGLIRQTGGLASVVENTAVEEKEFANDNKDLTLGEVAIGVFGGTGRYELVDGTFKTAHNVFVGGALTNDLRRYHKNYATLDKYHDAQGTLAISGGSFNTTTNIVLGRDGTGVIELSGTGTVSAASIIVSKTEGQEASGIRFTADATGKCGKIAPATKLVFEPGAYVSVDVSEMATQEQPRRFVVWNLDTAPEGIENLNLDVVGNDDLQTPNSLELSNDGKTLAWNVVNGTIFIIR